MMIEASGKGPRLYTVSAAARALGVVYNTVRNAIESGKLKAIDNTVGATMISETELQRYKDSEKA